MRSFASKASFPSAYAVLMLVLVLGSALTWVLPAGRYDLLRYDQSHRSFVAERATGEETLPGEQATLDRLGIQIRIDHFKKRKKFESRSRFPVRITRLTQIRRA
jgi:uncharacterized ion transporter superfamily protein YfcC